jgi:hypothetical protein
LLLEVAIPAPAKLDIPLRIHLTSAVFEIAPAQVLHGAVRLQGLASSPVPDTHVRVAGMS